MADTRLMTTCCRLVPDQPIANDTLIVDFAYSAGHRLRPIHSPAFLSVSCHAHDTDADAPY